MWRARDLADGERRFDLHAEPRAELHRVGQGAPDPLHRRGDLDRLLDIVRHMQPPGCIYLDHPGDRRKPSGDGRLRHHPGNAGEQVPRQIAEGADLGCQMASGEGVEIDPGHRGVGGRRAARQQAADDARKDIARAADAETGGARAVAPDPAVRRGDVGVRASSGRRRR